MEFSFDGEEVTLYNFPKTLLSSEDYIFVMELIEDFITVYELEHDQSKNSSLDAQIYSASARATESSSSPPQKDKSFEL